MCIVEQKNWGICGFVSVLNGLRAAGKLTKLSGGTWVAMDLEEIQTRLYAEILTYLKYLIFTRSPLVAGIEAITDVCRPKGEPKRDLQALVTYVEGRLHDIADQPLASEGAIRAGMRGLLSEADETAVTIAMTPEALVNYMKWTGVKNATDLKITTTQNKAENWSAYKNCMIGLGEFTGPEKPFNGLEHWVYVDPDGVLNNWGKTRQITPTTNTVSMIGSWAKFLTHVIRMT